MRKIVFVLILLVIILGISLGCRERTFTVQYCIGFDRAEETKVYTFDDSNCLQIPTCEGYTFLGWYDNPSFQGKMVESLVGNKNCKLYAKWESKEITLTYLVEGAILNQFTMRVGEKVPAAPAVPEKEGYLGEWSVVPNAPLKDLAIVAKYTLRQMTVIFRTELGDVVRTVGYNQTLTHIPEVPKRDKMIGSWSISDFSAVKTDLLVTANYKHQDIRVMFYGEGVLLHTQTIEYGGSLTQFPAIPEKIGHTGVWEKTSLTNLVEDCTVNLIYTRNQYTLTFYDENKVTELYTRTVAHGSDLIDVPKVLERKGYWGSWSQTTFVNITAAMDVFMVYREIRPIVSFYDGQTLLHRYELTYATGLSQVPNLPTCEGYIVSWSVLDFDCIMQNISVYLVREKIIHTVTFTHANGNIEKFRVPYGETLITIPSLEKCVGFEESWSHTDFTSVKADLEVIAIYTPIIFTITFQTRTGDVLDVRTIEYGKILLDIPSIPEKEGFTACWSENLSIEITENKTVYADYSQIKIFIYFYTMENKLLKTCEVEFGSDLSASEIPKVPIRLGYAGVWDKTSFTQLKQNMIIKPIYTANSLTITFMAQGATVAIKTVLYGETLTDIPLVPAQVGYTGAWETTDFNNITSSQTVTAIYTANGLTITFVAQGATVAIKTVLYGETLTDIPLVPAQVGYTGAWETTDFNNITSSQTVTAIYTEQVVKFSFSRSEDRNYYNITGYTGTAENLIVPSQNNGNPVKNILANVFQGNLYLKSVKLEQGIEIIGDNAFAECVNLCSVEIPNSVYSIGNNAFSGTNIKSIVLEEPQTQHLVLGNSVFANCKNLQEVNLRCTTMPEIGETIFAYSTNCILKVLQSLVAQYKINPPVSLDKIIGI